MPAPMTRNLVPGGPGFVGLWPMMGVWGYVDKARLGSDKDEKLLSIELALLYTRRGKTRRPPFK